MIPLMEAEIIVRHGWLTPVEFIDIIAIAETTPGPIAINAATYVGFRLAGIIGSITATLGVIAPSLLILLVAGRFLMDAVKKPCMENITQGLRLAIIVLILLAALSLGRVGLVDRTTYGIATALFLGSVFFKINPFYLLAVGAILGLIFYPY